MSGTVTTPADPGPSDPSGSATRTVSVPAHTWIYRQLTSMRFALLLLVVLSLLTLVGTLLIQVPVEVKGDSAAYEEWLESVRPRYGGWTGVLDFLGLFSVFSSVWFKGAVALLTVSLLTCSARRVPKLWKTAMRPRMVMTRAFFERSPHRARIGSASDPEVALAAVRDTFRKHRFRTAVERHGDELHVCADRFRWGPFGRVLVHISFVVILLGAALTATGGFRDEGFAVPVGEKRRVGHGTDLAVRVDSFADTYYLSGEPRDYVSDLVLYDDGKPVKSQEVRVNHPMRYDGVSFYQSFFGSSVVLRAEDRKGKVLFDRAVPLVYVSKDETHQIGSFSLPEQGLEVFAVTPKSGEVDPRIGPGQAQVEVYRSGTETPAGFRVLSPGKAKRIAGIDFTLVRERMFTGLVVARDLGWTPVWIGSTLLVAGLCMIFLFPHRRVRAVVRSTAGGSETGIAAIRRRDAAFARQFGELVEDIRRAVTTAGAEGEGS